jgi:hypothetical protein
MTKPEREDIMADRWTWVAHRTDGTDYPEIGPDGVARGWADAGADIRAIELLPQGDGERRPVAVWVPAGATAVCFRRRRRAVRSDGGASAEQPSVTVIGWERGDQAAYRFVHDDGSVLFANDREAIP